jgi:peptide/nickel transport system substrate-binding protein
MEYGAFFSAMTSKTNAPGYFMNNGHTNPTTSIRKSFVTGQTWNPSQWADPAYDKKMEEVYRTRDEGKRRIVQGAFTSSSLVMFALGAWFLWSGGP